MKRFNIVVTSIFVGSLIGLCVLILSYTHTTALFERSGYRGVLAHVGVIGFELTFVFGSIVVVWSRWVGAKVATSSRFVFGLGVFVNLYSNITSGLAINGKPLIFYTLDNGLALGEPVLIGALIPCLFVAAEMVVTDALHKYRTLAQNSHTVTQSDTKATRVEQAAHEFKQKEGKLPSIRRLAEITGETQHTARQVLGNLKQSRQKDAS